MVASPALTYRRIGTSGSSHSPGLCELLAWLPRGANSRQAMDLRGARHQGTPTHHTRSVPACAQPHLSRNVRSDALDVLRVLSLVERAGCYRVLSDWQPHSHQHRGTAVARNVWRSVR